MVYGRRLCYIQQLITEMAGINFQNSCSAAFSYSINFLWSLGSVWASLRKLFHSRFCGSHYTAALFERCSPLLISTSLFCADTSLSRYQFTPWSSGASEIHFLRQEKMMFDQCRIRTTDLSICSQRAMTELTRPKTTK